MQRLSSIYNLNSTIYQSKPTGKVAFITGSNKQSELALPVLGKIKNKELILTDYRLEIGHFKSLVRAFEIEPDMLEKVTLNNCGLQEESFTLLLSALLRLNCVRHLQVCKGDFATQSISELRELIQRRSFASL